MLPIIATAEQTTKVSYVQPYETKVKVLEKMNAKGELQPEAEIVITRKLENKEDIEKYLLLDLASSSNKVKQIVKSLSE